MLAAPYIALTDQAWFDFLATRAVGGRVDEVNFWSPSSLQPLRRMASGEPVFFRSKSPRNAISGYGFFAHFAVLGLEEAWDTFGWKNGDPDALRFLQRIGRYRRIDLLAPGSERAPLGCTILRDAMFWPTERLSRNEDTASQNAFGTAGNGRPSRERSNSSHALRG